MDGGKLPCLLVENKCDLLEEAEQDNVAALKEFSDRNEFLGCFRVSAKTGKNIDASMEFLIHSIVERMEKIDKKDGKEVFSAERKNVSLTKENHAPSKEKKKKDNCC
ncbi:MAG: hypothetical protein MJ252_29160 [archaeon]|nr:hypothetical protein [archaeon]